MTTAPKMTGGQSDQAAVRSVTLDDVIATCVVAFWNAGLRRPTGPETRSQVRFA